MPTSCYIFNIFYYLFMSFFLTAGTCLIWGLPSHIRSRSLSSQAACMDHWLFDWRITDLSIRSNAESTLLWMDGKANFPVWRPVVPIDRGIQKAWIKLTYSFIHSFIFMIETYLSLFKCLFRSTAQHIHRFFDPVQRNIQPVCVCTVHTLAVVLIQQFWVIISFRC